MSLLWENISLLIKEPNHVSVVQENDFGPTWIYFWSVRKNQKQIDCSGYAEWRLTLSLASDCLKSGENERDQIETDFSFASDRLIRWRKSEVMQNQN